jgi:hypothetical protein
MILKITLMRAIGMYCVILSAPGTFGISDSTPKLRRAMSILPRIKSLRMCKTPCFTKG